MVDDTRTPNEKAKGLNPGADAKAQALIDEFDAAFTKALAKDAAELGTRPKVHDHTKGEYIEEVDPAIADK